MQTENNPPDILQLESNLVRAGTGKRMANYLIDILAFYAVVFLLAILLALIWPGMLDGMDDSNAISGLPERIIAIFLYAVFMGILEAVSKGKSLGKLITRTRAINLDGSTISTGTAFTRGFARAVPFCVLSAFGSPCNPWQDKWTKTLVIDEKTSMIS